MPSDGECYEKMVYKFFKDVTTMIPKCSTQLKDVQAYFKVNTDDYVLNSKAFNKPLTITKEVFDLNNVLYGKYKKFQKGYLTATGDNVGYTHAVNVWIKFCMDFLDSYDSTCIYDFSSLKPESYLSLDSFYQDVNLSLYKLSFTDVSASFIDQLVEEGKMYLFQIYNKDFSEYSKGTPNMHTLYWKALFDERNLADVVYKFMFHVPITMNFKSSGSENINQDVKVYLRHADDMHIIGIDRGERHLLYLVVIDLQGNIKEQYSLNEIVNEYNGNTYRTNYHDLLDVRADKRLKASQSWQTIENIKELKEGYLSQAIHKITQLMVKYHAVVVLEDLNKEFMRGRQKVEKQVYQKFEKMLIDKLNYLVDKHKDANETGGLLHALQLTSGFKNFKKSDPQSGFLFYIPAWNTSKIDPVTGFVNLFNTKYTNAVKAQEFFSKFDEIRYNEKKDWFEFEFDYDEFTQKAHGTRTRWTLCTHGKRLRSFRNPANQYNWDSEVVALTDEFKRILGEAGIDIHENLKDAISNLEGKRRKYLEPLMQFMKLLLQLRNSKAGTDEDYILSPVADENGIFYDSRSCGDELPENADANGAYNIARKGLMMIEQIKDAKDLDNLKFDISNKAWLNFAQQKPYKK